MKRFFITTFFAVLIGLFSYDVGYAEEALEVVEEAPAIEEVQDEEPLSAPESIEEEEALTSIKQPVWERIAGATALKTMQKVVRTDNVFPVLDDPGAFLCTESNYKDALACAGLAGFQNACILITNKDKLSPETKAEIKRLGIHWVVIVGGESAVSTTVEKQVSKIFSVRYVSRIAGKTAVGTANALFHSNNVANWDRTVVVVTGDGYKDALSIAPFAYWAHAPMFLTRSSKDSSKRILPPNAIEDIKQLAARRQGRNGVDKVVIIGGLSAVSSKVEKQLDEIGVTHIRLAGKNAIETSEYCAWFSLSEGMNMKHLTVATTKSYKDALCAVPICGQLGSVMVLCNPKGGLSAFDHIYSVTSVEHGHVIGGESAISAENFDYIARNMF